MITDDRLKEIAIEQGEAIEVTHSDDEIGNYHYVYSFELNELRAFINAVHVEEYEQMKVSAEYIKRLEETLEYVRNTLLGKGIPSDTVVLGRMSIAKYKCENLIMQALASRPENLG